MSENYQQNDSSRGDAIGYAPVSEASQQQTQPQAMGYMYPQVALNVQPAAIPPDYSKTVTMGDWFIFFLLQCIPILNFIVLIYYACDSDKPSRANLARLTLILTILITVVGAMGLFSLITLGKWVK